MGEILQEQLSQRAGNVLMNPNLTDREREFLRGELSYGSFIASYPQQAIEAAEAALMALRVDEGEWDG